MGQRGPKPTPASVHLLRGNPSKLNKDQLESEADAVPSRIPSTPHYLDGIAMREWKRITRILRLYGLVTLLDRAALTVYCISYARWVAAEEYIGKLGIDNMVQETRSGSLTKHPMIAIAATYHAQLVAAMKEFGLSPSARRGLSLSQKEDGDPDIAEDDTSPERFFS